VGQLRRQAKARPFGPEPVRRSDDVALLRPRRFTLAESAAQPTLHGPASLDAERAVPKSASRSRGHGENNPTSSLTSDYKLAVIRSIDRSPKGSSSSNFCGERMRSSMAGAPPRRGSAGRAETSFPWCRRWSDNDVAGMLTRGSGNLPGACRMGGESPNSRALSRRGARQSSHSNGRVKTLKIDLVCRVLHGSVKFVASSRF
jgi:hypothetical protein